MSAVEKLVEIKESVTIPVMAKCRIGHFVEARIIQALSLDYIDESEVLTPADVANHVDKHGFKIPFVCGARDLGEALRRIGEGAAMIRTKGEAGTGDIVEAVTHMRKIMSQIRKVTALPDDEIMAEAKRLQAPYELLKEVHRLGRLPVVNFAAGGVATPADAALMMHLGAEGVFVGSGIFKSDDPENTGQGHRRSRHPLPERRHAGGRFRGGLGEPMRGIAVEQMAAEELLAKRGLVALPVLIERL